MPTRPDQSPARTAGLAVTALEDRVTPATLHWLGSAAAGGDLWSAPANWLEARAPVSGDRLVFDTTTPGFSASANGFAPSNDLAGLTGLSLGLNDASSAGDFAVAGNPVALAGVGVTGTVSVGTAAAVNNPLTLSAATTVSAGLGTLTLGGALSGSGSLLAAGSPSATLTLGGANTYTGGTVVTSGTVGVGTNTALGSGTLTFNGGTLSNSVSFLNLPNPFTVSAPSTIAGGGFLTLGGNGVLNAGLTAAHTGFLTLSGALSGPAGLRVTGFPGNLVLSGTTANTFAGGVTVVFGGLTLQKTAGVTAVASSVNAIGSFTSVTLGASNQLNGTPVALGQDARLSTAGFSDTVSSLTGLGDVDTGTAAGAGLTVTGGGSQLLAGAVGGSGRLTYGGSGSLTLAGPSASYTGTLTAAAGSLLVSADFSGATAAVTGGSLGGTGVVRSIAATGGFVDPGAGPGGTLNTAAVAAATSLGGGTFRADLLPRGASDQLALGPNATLNLTGAVLVLNAPAAPLASRYQLITSPTGGISGTFTGLANGATVTAGGQQFTISYTPTAVTLTNAGAGPRVLRWIGAAGSSWNAAGNWAENVSPASGDTLVFDTTTPGFAGSAAAFAPNNTVAGLTNIAVVINDNSTAGDFTISGNPFGLSTAAGPAVASTVAAGTAATVNNPLTLGANTTVAPGLGSLVLGGSVGGGFSLTVAGSPAGSVTLSANNGHTGGTVIASGTLLVGANGSLGSGALTLSGGTLANAAAFLEVPNAFTVTAPSTIGGGSFFDLLGNGVLNAELRLTNTGFLTLSGALSGPGGLTEDGFPGSTTLAGGAANTYTGPTRVISGGLTLDKTDGVTAVPTSVTLEGGSFPNLTLSSDNQVADGATVTLGAGSELRTGTFTDAVTGLAGTGRLATGSTSGGLTVFGPGLFAGELTGGGFLRSASPTPFTVAGTGPSFDGFLVASGSLVVAGSFPSAVVLLQSGTLGGTGLVEAVSTTGGTLDPAGVLSTAGAATGLGAGVTARFDLSDSGPSDQLVVGSGGTVNLANAGLSVNVLSSSAGTVFYLVTSPSGGITGTFAGLPDNSTLTVNGRLFRVRYTANAVTLTDLQSITLAPPALPAAEVGFAYNQSVTATGGTGPITLAVSNVSNPTGLTITGSGTASITVSGTPTAAGTLTFTVTPSDSNGPQAGTVYTVTVNPPVTLNPPTLPAGTVGAAYAVAVVPTGGTGAVTLTVSGVTNTTGLVISGSGTDVVTVTGTPTTAGTVMFTVTPTDGFGAGTPVTYSFTVNPAVTINPAALPAGEAGISYSQSITATGGTAPVTLAVSGVTNTTGLTIAGSGTGVITVSGTPTAAGTVTFTVTATDAAGAQTVKTYSFVVNPAVVLSPAALPTGEVGVAYNRTITPTGGSGTVTLTVSGVSNPTGLTITGSGTGTVTVSGTPTAAGTVTFTVTPSDAIGTGAAVVYSFTVAPRVSLTPATLPAGTAGVGYTRTVTSAGGVGPVTLAVSGVSNATGLTISGSGTGTVTLSGTPTAAGVVTFTVTATDALGAQAVATYSVAVNPAVALAPATLPAGEAGVAYSQTVTATGGTGPVTLAVSGVTNTTGLTISGSGTGAITVSGTPTGAGTVTFTVTPSDAAGTSPGRVYSFAVNPAVTLTPAFLPAGVVGLAYNQTVTPTGGTGAVTLAVSNVSNPTGLTISGDGTGSVTVSGTPTAAGQVTFTVTPTGALGAGPARVYSFPVSVPAPVVLTPPTLPGGTVGAGYTQTVTATGGTGTVTLAVSNVTNATGLTITGSGTGTVTVSGTPTAAGTLTFTVTPSDATGVRASTVYTVVVSLAPVAPVVLAPATLPGGRVGLAYSQSVTGSGGSGPLTLRVSGVTNSTGLTISGDGTGAITLSGTPTAAGTVLFTVTATDAAGGRASTVYAVAVAARVTRFAVGSGAGGPSAVTAYNADGTAAGTADPFPGFAGGVRTAAADFNGDGVPDLVAGTGPGRATRVEVRDGATGSVLFAVDPFEERFQGGVFVAAGDLTGDGVPDLVITPDQGGGPRVRVFTGDGFGQVADFFGIEDTQFRGGARASVGDITGDGVGDLVVAAGFGGGPRVAAFDGTSLVNGAYTVKPFADFFAFEEGLRNGVYVAAGDVDGDGLAELVAGGGPGGGPRVSAFSGSGLLRNSQTRVADFFAGDPENRGGVRLAAKDLDGDGRADIVAGAGDGAGSRVTAYAGRAVVGVSDPAELFAFDAFAGVDAGVFVG